MSSPEEIKRLAESLMKEKCWPDAIKLLTSNRNLVSQDWRLSWNLGWCYFNISRLSSAQKYFAHATELAPSSHACKWALGIVYVKKRNYKKAEGLLYESLCLKESHRTRIALALAYLAQGKISEAEKIHLEGIKLKPKQSEKYESYAAFLHDVGRAEEARKMDRKAARLRRLN